MPYAGSGKVQAKVLALLLIVFIMAVAGLQAQESGDYIHYRLGVKYKNEKKYDQALDEFRKVLAAYPDNYNAYMHIAEIRSEQKNYRLVIYNLKKALAYNPGWSKATKMLAASYEADGQYQKAIVELQNYLQACDPAERDSIQHNVDRLVARVNGDTTYHAPAPKAPEPVREPEKPAVRGIPSGAKAMTNVKQSVQPSPSNPEAEALFKDAVALYNQKNFDGALEKIRRVLAIDRNHSGAYYYGGMIRRRNGQNDMAKYNFLRAINYPDLGFNSHFYLGKIYGEEKNYSEALKHLSAYVAGASSIAGKKEAQDLIDKYKKLGGASIPADSSAKSAMQPDTAISEETAYTPIEIRIDSLLAMVTIDTITDAGQKLLAGINAFRDGNFDKAVKEFKLVLISSPGAEVSVHCLYNTGVCYFKMHLYKQAENQFTMLLDKFPHHKLAPQAVFLRALSFIERDETTAGEKMLRDFIQNYRTHEWVGKAYEKLGDCYTDMEQQKKAADAYAQAASQSTNPIDKVSAYFKLGNVYAALSNNPRAITSFLSAIETGEKHQIYLRVPDSYYKIADMQYQQKEYKSAMDFYKRVTRKYPSYQETPWGLFQIGSIYRNLKQYQQAIDVFKDLIKRYPEDYWSKQAQWKIDDAVWENEYRAILQ